MQPLKGLMRHTILPITLGLELLLITSCIPRGYQTPNPTRFNEGLNSYYPDQEPDFTADGRYLVFASSRDGYQAIYLYDRIEDRLVDLPNLNSEKIANSSPDISADGRFIAYLSNELGKSEVFVYDRQTQISEDISSRIPGDVRNPTLSGEGRYVAFESNGFGEWNIEIFDRGPNAISTNPQQPPKTTQP